jgi:hypothetical protein
VQLADIVVRRLFVEGDALIPLAMGGGVFRYSSIVRDVFCNTMSSLDPRLQVNRQVVEPVTGALMMARKAHVPPEAEVR